MHKKKIKNVFKSVQIYMKDVECAESKEKLNSKYLY